MTRALLSSTRVFGAALAATALTAAACARMPRSVAVPSGQPDMAVLWEDPHDLESRDLFQGPGNTALAPSPDAQYAWMSTDRSGYSPGYDVRGPDGMVWSVKMGPEAQPEVVASRVLWAIGYHQPPTYYVERWTLVDKVTTQQAAGRFRPTLPDRKVVADWSWYENEFVSTRPFKGLLVANVILNNWDWKTSNNKIYEIRSANGPARRLYVVQDLGASLGKTTFPAVLNWFPMRGFGQGTRNDLSGFESQRLLKRVTSDGVQFDYRGIHKRLLDSVSVDDIVWACRLLSRLSDAQWEDAFRAAGYGADHRQRYVKKIKSKIAEGSNISGSARARSRLPRAPA
jgi:hypothetical protein